MKNKSGLLEFGLGLFIFEPSLLKFGPGLLEFERSLEARASAGSKGVSADSAADGRLLTLVVKGGGRSPSLPLSIWVPPAVTLSNLK